MSAALAFGASATPAWAQQGARSSMAVLNIEGEGVDRDTADALSAVVRSEAQQIAEYQVVNASPINLSEVVMLLDCDASSTACLRKAAEQLDARVLIYGTMFKEKSGYRLELAIFDAPSGETTHRMRRALPGQDLVFESRQEIEAFFSEVRQDQIAAKLSIASNVRGATVTLNGVPSGTTPLEALKIPPGPYAIEVSKPGFESWTLEVELGESATTTLRATLDPAPGEQGEATAATSQDLDATTTSRQTDPLAPRVGGGVGEELDVRRRRDGVNLGAISLLSVGGVSLAASSIAAVRMNRLSDELTADARAGRLTPSEREAGIERGLALQRAHRVLLGLGAASALGGAVWLIVDVSREREPGAVSLSVSPFGVSATCAW